MSKKKTIAKQASQGSTPQTKIKEPIPTPLVAYNHVTGEPFLVDASKGTLAPINLNLPEGREALKDESGHYRTEVRNECRRLFFQNVSITEIVRRTGVGRSALENWAFAKHAPQNYDKCWMADRERLIQAARQYNQEMYGALESKALQKVEAYLNSPKSDIQDVKMFNDFAGGIQKLSKSVVSEKPQKSKNTSGQPNTIQINVNPLTPAEALDMIHNDPIRRIAQAQTRIEAAAALSEATILSTDSEESGDQRKTR